MARQTNWLTVLSDFVLRHPKTSAAVAFNLGVIAAQASKRGRKITSGAIDIPAKLIELVPSVKDLGGFLPMLGTPKPKRRAPARHGTRKTKAPASTAAKRRKSAR